MTTTEIKPVHSGNIYQVPVELIDVDESFNVRTDYGDIETLSESIKVNGIRNPLSAYKKDGRYFITDGFRRMRAVKKAISEGAEIKSVPVLPEGRGYNTDERYFDMLIKNDGKNLNSLEQAELFKRLKNNGFSTQDIAKKIGRTDTYVNDMLNVSSVPKTIKNEIIEGNISTKTVSEVFKIAKGNEDTIKEIVSEAKKEVEKEGKTKVKPKDIQKVVKRINNITETLFEVVENVTNPVVLFSSNEIDKVFSFLKEITADVQIQIVRVNNDSKKKLGFLQLEINQSEL